MIDGMTNRMTDDMPLRVLIALDVAPDRNGVATYWGDLTRLLTSRGVITNVMCAGRTTELHPAIHLKRAFAMPLFGDNTQSIVFPTAGAVGEAVQRFNPTLIIVPAPGPVAILSALTALRRGIPLIASIHTDLSVVAATVVPGPSGRLAGWLVGQLDAFLVRNAQVVVAPGTAHAQAMGVRFGVNVRAVATPLAPVFTTPVPNRPARSVRSVLYVGRLSPEKNVGSLIDAARVHPDLEFRLIGDGPDAEVIRRSAPSNVRMYPWQPRALLGAQIDRCDLVVLPSSVETFGTAALEAMARARLVIVSSAAGIASIIVDGENGLLCSAGEAVSSCIARARSLPALVVASIGERARCTALGYSEQCVSDWLRVLVDVAPTSSSAFSGALLDRCRREA